MKIKFKNNPDLTKNPYSSSLLPATNPKNHVL